MTETKQIHVKVSPERHRAVKMLAAQKETTVQALVSGLLDKELKKTQGDKPGTEQKRP